MPLFAKPSRSLLHVIKKNLYTIPIFPHLKEMEVIPLDKKEKLKSANKNASHNAKKPIVLDQAPDPRGKTGARYRFR